MTGIKYMTSGTTCTTRCPFGEDRFVGSIACESCRHHFMKLSGLRQVVCKRERQS